MSWQAILADPPAVNYRMAVAFSIHLHFLPLYRYSNVNATIALSYTGGRRKRRQYQSLESTMSVGVWTKQYS